MRFKASSTRGRLVLTVALASLVASHPARGDDPDPPYPEFKKAVRVRDRWPRLQDKLVGRGVRQIRSGEVGVDTLRGLRAPETAQAAFWTLRTGPAEGQAVMIFRDPIPTAPVLHHEFWHHVDARNDPARYFSDETTSFMRETFVHEELTGEAERFSPVQRARKQRRFAGYSAGAQANQRRYILESEAKNIGSQLAELGIFGPAPRSDVITQYLRTLPPESVRVGRSVPRGPNWRSLDTAPSLADLRAAAAWEAEAPVAMLRARPGAKVAANVALGLVLACDNTGELVEASGNACRPYTGSVDDGAMWALGPVPAALDRLANNCVVDSVMDPIESGFNLLRFRVSSRGIKYTGSFRKGNGKDCWSFDYGKRSPWRWWGSGE